MQWHIHIYTYSYIHIIFWLELWLPMSTSKLTKSSSIFQSQRVVSCSSARNPWPHPQAFKSP